ncbi:LADA_0C11078g1_1 [Lachancea dasiensis]|uniref:LADA_0C11078g1_1 n=1 Tax=Lachancea dasiensis TaxID=1072105 RepID=A0A1G4J1U8_9SACH|nr:LADA_0C11078g1_1 [Lachancea dasiensis]
MSVCLAVTKTIAVSSLGIYCGTLCSATILARCTPLDVLRTQLARPAKAVARVAASLAAVSSVFFGLSFFGAPLHLRHPYLLYGMLVGPVSGIYVGLAGRVCKMRRCRSQRPKDAGLPAQAVSPAPAPEPVLDASLDDSVVDLGQPAPEDAPPAAPPAAPAAASELSGTPPVTCHSASSCLGPIPVLFGISVVGLVEAVLGLYGEGLFV